MDKNKMQELLEVRAQADQELEKMRASVTILFSDIKGSTTYFEKNGDVEGLAMVERHHSLMLPVIEGAGGRVVKTIGDAIMASFADPVGAVKAAIGMQRALEEDRPRPRRRRPYSHSGRPAHGSWSGSGQGRVWRCGQRCVARAASGQARPDSGY
jgi:class 3 adenylate cyclase